MYVRAFEALGLLVEVEVVVVVEVMVKPNKARFCVASAEAAFDIESLNYDVTSRIERNLTSIGVDVVVVASLVWA
jgi:hypothetical protein